MDLTYVNVFVYFLLTLLYFTYKATPQLSDVATPEAFNTFSQKSYRNLTIYFVVLLVIQYFMNASIVITKCGGLSSNSFYLAAKYTFFPWIFIYGIMIIILVAFPGFKSAFSDVLGYAYVSNRVNTLFTQLLVNPDVNDQVKNLEDENKRKLQDTADAILKIFGNLSILINQIVPENFENFWKILTPLMKDTFRNQPISPELVEMKKELLGLVAVRENVGELVWYIYTAILIIVIVQYYINANGCLSDSQTMQDNYQTFLDNEKNTKDAQIINNEMIYNVRQ
jgi:hypothetical protein